MVSCCQTNYFQYTDNAIVKSYVWCIWIGVDTAYSGYLYCYCFIYSLFYKVKRKNEMNISVFFAIVICKRDKDCRSTMKIDKVLKYMVWLCFIL